MHSDIITTSYMKNHIDIYQFTYELLCHLLCLIMTSRIVHVLKLLLLFVDHFEIKITLK